MLIPVNDKEFYEGHENFLHIVLKPTIKKHRGRDAEFIGKVMDSKCDKRRRNIIEEIWKESMIHLHEHPVSLFDNLGYQSIKS